MKKYIIFIFIVFSFYSFKVSAKGCNVNITTSDKTTYCMGENIHTTFYVNAGCFMSMNTLEATNIIWYKEGVFVGWGDTYSATDAGAFSCTYQEINNGNLDSTIYTYNFAISIVPPVPVPVISLFSANQLRCSASLNYHWYFNDVSIPNAYNRTCPINQIGYYSVEVTDTLGQCKSIAWSEKYYYTNIKKQVIDKTFIGPNPIHSSFRIEINSSTTPNAVFTIYNMLGTIVYEKAITDFITNLSKEDLEPEEEPLRRETNSVALSRTWLRSYNLSLTD